MDWGCCVLHVFGDEFDPDAFLPGSSLRPYKVFYRGQPQAREGRRAELVHEWSGFTCDVSEAPDLRDQVKDATAFLTRHANDLARAAADRTIQRRQLDFGYECRLSDRIWVQRDYLPAEFLRLAGSLEIGIALSLYPGEGLEPKVLKEQEHRSLTHE